MGRAWEPQTFDEWDELMKEEEAREYAHTCFCSGGGMQGCRYSVAGAFWGCPLHGLCNQVAKYRLKIPKHIKTQLRQLSNVV